MISYLKTGPNQTTYIPFLVERLHNSID